MKFFFNRYVYILYFISFVSFDFEDLTFLQFDTFLYGIRIIFSVITFYIFLILITIYPKIFLYIKKNLKSFLIIITIFFILSMVFSLIQNEILLSSIFKITSSYIFLLYNLMYYLYDKSYIKSLVFSLIILNILNLITYLLFPTIGVYGLNQGQHYLEGILKNRNGIVLYTIPLILLSFYTIRNFWYKWVIVFLSIFITLLTGSDTAFILILLLFTFILFKSFNYLLVIITLLINIFTIVFAISSLQATTEIFKFDSGFNNRDIIWKESIFAIKNFDFLEIVVGKGFDSNFLTGFLNNMTGTNQALINDPMNSLLSMFFYHGLIGFIFFIILILICTKENSAVNDKLLILKLYLPLIIVNSISENLFKLNLNITWLLLLIIVMEKNEEVKNEDSFYP